MQALIEIRGDVATVKGPTPEFVMNHLSAVYHDIAAGSGPLRVQRLRDDFVTIADDGNTLIHRGLVQRLVAILRKARWVVKIVEAEKWPQMLQAQQRLLELQPDVTPLQRSLARNPIGQVITHSTRHVGETITSAIKLYDSRTNVLVLAKDEMTMRKLAQQLEQTTGGRDVHVLGKRSIGPWAGSIVITSPITGVGSPTRTFGLAFYVGRETALHKQVLETYTGPVGNVVRYAIIPASEKLNPHETLCVEMVFGPPIFRFAPAKAPFAPHVAWLPSPRLPQPTRSASQSQTVIHNDPRNRFIARMAQAIVNRDWEELWPLLPTSRVAELASRSNLNVAIVVANMAHGYLLHQHLQNWPLLTANNPTNSDHAGGMIVTGAFAIDGKIPASIVINAAGGSVPMTRKPIGLSMPGESVLVIDLADGGGSEARARCEEYRSMGWHVDLLPIVERFG